LPVWPEGCLLVVCATNQWKRPYATFCVDSPQAKVRTLPDVDAPNRILKDEIREVEQGVLSIAIPVPRFTASAGVVLHSHALPS
jgi:hypothetical protein